MLNVTSMFVVLIRRTCPGLYRNILTPIKAIFHWTEFSARNDIFFSLNTNWRRVGVKRQKKILFRPMENSPKALSSNDEMPLFFTDDLVTSDCQKLQTLGCPKMSDRLPYQSEAEQLVLG